MEEIRYLIGIDEAGRGPLAGPVVVGGIRIESGIMNHELWNGIKDSKKLSAKQREKWFECLTNHPEIKWAVAHVWPTTIDRIHIKEATNLGARRVYAKLCSQSPHPKQPHPKLSLGQESIIKIRGKSRIGTNPKLSLGYGGRGVGGVFTLLDGGLSLSKSTPHKAIIKGDEKIPIISAASIIAKVTRDRLMVRLHKRYPEYRFDLHKGYGTVLHREMIREFGRCEVHRQSFKIAVV
ncbi:MAG: hypothetical protein G01um101433_284 [Parcubacteria group bacterium Gr01-1014_33]|nr:MAG: hypothetical protein G01um101433_284 [Parcubacteria group bacterium Gr01-1014_33]